jgi:hypothetical protein
MQRRVGRFTLDTGTSGNLSGNVGALAKIRDNIGRLLRGKSVRNLVDEGNLEVIAEINRKLAKYDELLKEVKPVAELRDNAGWQKLVATMKADMEEDARTWPEQTLRLYCEDNTRVIVNAVMQLLWRKFIGIWEQAENEVTRGREGIALTLRELDQKEG